MADVTVTDNPAAGRYEVNLDGDTAFAEYSLAQGVMILPHTVVPTAFEGKGVGSALAKAALGRARAEGRKVIPTCPFIAAYIQKHPEWHDIVHDTHKARLGIA
jgi:predicted GNAT family acetyltransferase